jgi:hypothetical protein
VPLYRLRGMRSGALALGELGATMDGKPILICGGGIAGLTLKPFFSHALLKFALGAFGTKSALAGRA